MLSKKEAAFYLAGLVDGEGCIGSYSWLNKKKETIRVRVITIGMADKEIIDYAAKCFKILEIPYWQDDKGRMGTKKVIWTIEISSYVGMVAFQKLVPIKHLEKQKKLQIAIDSFVPPTCTKCGIEWDSRTIGCSVCQQRHAYRVKREKAGYKSKVGIKELGVKNNEAGRPPKIFPEMKIFPKEKT